MLLKVIRRRTGLVGLTSSRHQPLLGGLVLDSHNRHIHGTSKQQSVLIIGGLGIAASAVAIQYGYEAYKSFDESRKASAAAQPNEEQHVDSSVKSEKAEAEETNKDSATKKNESSKEQSAPAPAWFTSFFSKTFYDGGFEDKMSRREAALVLGVRESATEARIKDAHRRILLLNHPDRGGSAFLAAKINEAKDLLLKGK